MISRAGGPAGRLARSVKLADLQDRIRHDHRQANGSRLPYERALELILDGFRAEARAEAGHAIEPDPANPLGAHPRAAGSLTSIRPSLSRVSNTGCRAVAGPRSIEPSRRLKREP